MGKAPNKEMKNKHYYVYKGFWIDGYLTEAII